MSNKTGENYHCVQLANESNYSRLPSKFGGGGRFSINGAVWIVVDMNVIEEGRRFLSRQLPLIIHYHLRTVTFPRQKIV